MLNTILVPLDGSALAERALPFAARVCRASRGRLVLVRAALDVNLWTLDLGDAPYPALDQGPSELELARAELAEVAERLRDEGLSVETRLVEDDPMHAIRQVAQQTGTHLIVMATHGRSGLGRWIYGSVADRIMRHADVPVLLVPAGAEAHWTEEHPRRVLVALDGSELARTALGPALELAAVLEAEVVLLQVVIPPSYIYPTAYPYLGPHLEEALAESKRYLVTLANELSTQGRRVGVRTAVGFPASTIAAVAREEGADLVAMATHGRGGAARLVMGSVATGVVQRAEAPVLLTRPPAIRPEAVTGVSSGAATLTLGRTELEVVEKALRQLVARPVQDDQAARIASRLLSRLHAGEAANATKVEA
jgi:nucleotide-binding universal stress UspA family protein